MLNVRSHSVSYSGMNVINLMSLLLFDILRPLAYPLPTTEDGESESVQALIVPTFCGCYCGSARAPLPVVPPWPTLPLRLTNHLVQLSIRI